LITQMSATLDDDQITAPFAQAEDAGLPEPGEPQRGTRKASRVATVDFSRPTKFSKELERELRRTHEVFCRTAGTRLTAELRSALDLAVVGGGQLTWSSATLGLGHDPVCATVEIAPIGTRFMVSLERLFLLPLFERLCGGRQTGIPADRKFSEIDEILAARVFRMFIEQMSLIWQDVAGLQLTFLGIEPDPQTARIAGLSEATLVLTLDMKVHTGSHGLGVYFPFSSIEPVINRFITGQPDGGEEAPAQAAAVREAVGNVGLELRAEVGAVDATVDDLIRLQVGDVIELGSAVGGITVCAGDAELYRGQPGREGRKRAVQIIEEVER
jgi:flagellar motor switch protein FliM